MGTGPKATFLSTREAFPRWDAQEAGLPLNPTLGEGIDVEKSQADRTLSCSLHGGGYLLPLPSGRIDCRGEGKCRGSIPLGTCCFCVATGGEPGPCYETQELNGLWSCTPEECPWGSEPVCEPGGS